MTDKIRQAAVECTKELSQSATIFYDYHVHVDKSGPYPTTRSLLVNSLSGAADIIERAMRKLLDGYVKIEKSAGPTIEDGFGNVWSAKCAKCGRISMQVVRPGKIQCGYCG